jgi:Mrp family chromosome partitioning ATPase
VATSTAAALADLGRHVVLVDADLGSPGSSSLVPGSPYPGFGEVLTGRAEVEDALRPTPLENVRVLPAAASGPTGSLDVDNLRLMLGQLSARSLVVIDGPALLTSPETVILAEQADVVLLVAPMGSLRRRDVTSALRLLDGVHPSTVAWVALASPAIRRDGRGRRPGRGDPSDDVGGRWLTDRGVVDVSPPPSS